MNPVRLLRIAGVAALLVCLFAFSQRLTLEREGHNAPGIGWALGVLSVLLLIRAFVTEQDPRAQSVVQKDVLWGLGVGGASAVVYLLL